MLSTATSPRGRWRCRAASRARLLWRAFVASRCGLLVRCTGFATRVCVLAADALEPAVCADAVALVARVKAASMPAPAAIVRKLMVSTPVDSHGWIGVPDDGANEAKPGKSW